MSKGTPEERAAKRLEKCRGRRTEFFVKRMREALTGRQQLQQATDYAKAVGDDDLDDQGRRRLAMAVARATEEVKRDYGK